MRTLPLRSFENVGAGLTALMTNISLGETFHGFLLKLGGAFTKAQIDQILVRLSNKTIWNITGSQLDTINQYMGMTANAAYLLLPFSEFNARGVVGEAIGAIDTSLGYSGLDIQVKINAGAVNPTLEAWKLVTPDKLVDNVSHRPLFKAMLTNTDVIGAAGTFNLPFPTGSREGALIKRLHGFQANQTEFNVKLNGNDLQDQGEIDLVQFWQDNLTRVTQAGHFCFDPLVLDNQAEAIPTISQIGGINQLNNFEFRGAFSAADTLEMVSELYAPIGSV